MNQPRAPAATEGPLPERTSSEATALLVELGRAVKARSFYARGEPEVRLLLARAWRSLHANLLRHGPLEVTADAAGLCVPSLGLRVPSVQLGGLAQRLGERHVGAIRFEPALDADGLAALVDWLAADASDALADPFAAGGVRGVALNPAAPPVAARAARERYAPDTRMRGSDLASGVGARAPDAAAPASAPDTDAALRAPDTGAALRAPDAAAAARALGLALAAPSAPPSPPAIESAPSPGAAAPEPPASARERSAAPGEAAARPSFAPRAAPARADDAPAAVSPPAPPPALATVHPAPEEAAPPEEPAESRPEEPLAALLEPGPFAGPDAATDAAEPETEPEPELETDDPELGGFAFERDPSPPPFADSDATPASTATPRVASEDTDTEAVEADVDGPGLDDGEDGRPAQLDELLHELASCEDDFQYHDLARRAEALAAALADEGHVELGYRALTLFAHHAGDDGKRSPLQRDAAADHLQRLASGARLAELVDRACSTDSGASLAATQVLMRLGAAVVPTLFRASEREADPGRRGHLHGILIAMGDAALPEVLRTMESADVAAVRGAVRLAGEMQSPRAIQRLAELLEGVQPGLRQDAAKALVRIGDARAIDVLVRALESPVEGVPNLASYCLGPRAARARRTPSSPRCAAACCATSSRSRASSCARSGGWPVRSPRASSRRSRGAAGCATAVPGASCAWRPSPRSRACRARTPSSRSKRRPARATRSYGVPPSPASSAAPRRARAEADAAR